MFKHPDKEADVKETNSILSRFGDVPNDLYVFFHSIESGRMFISTLYFHRYKDKFPTEYDFHFMHRMLGNQNVLVRNLIKFYFVDLDDEAVEQCATSIYKIAEYIRDSKYSDEVKARLYEFFIDPSRYIQLLQYELMKKEALLSDYYKENYQKILDLYNQTTFETLSEQGKTVGWNINVEGTAYVSYSMLNKYHMSLYFCQEGSINILGCDYLYYLAKRDRTPVSTVKLNEFGAALCEESRIKILNFILEREWVTCKDLEKEFSFSGSTAYHHLVVMSNTKMLKIRNEGKTICYGINREYFDVIIDNFKEFSNN